MKPLNRAGFTIIETMLFLGITGLLVGALLVGTGASINIQRYRDSVNSLQSFFQQQYSYVSNVDNNIDAKSCINSAGINLTANRGQSDCVIIGRLIYSEVPESINAIPVVAYQKPYSISSPQTETNELNNYTYSLLSPERYELEWGTAILDSEGQPFKFAILIVRSPSSGTIKTFVKTYVDTLPTVKDIIYQTTDMKLCVDSRGLFSGTRMAISLKSNANSANGVGVLGDSVSGCK